MEQTAGDHGSFFTRVLLEAEKKARSKMNDLSKSRPHPKQGHHIINKGVINIYEDIIRQFVCCYEYNFIFEGESYDDLKKMKEIVNNGEEEALDFLFVKNPLLQESKDFIEGTTVFANGREYDSKNDEDFGIAKFILIYCVNALMFEIYDVLTEKEVNSLVSYFENHLLKLRDIIAEKFFPSPTKYVYVDYTALKLWKKENREESKFNDCKNAVQEMLENIACEQTTDKTPLIVKWGKGAFSINKALSSA